MVNYIWEHGLYSTDKRQWSEIHTEKLLIKICHIKNSVCNKVWKNLGISRLKLYEQIYL